MGCSDTQCRGDGKREKNRYVTDPLINLISQKVINPSRPVDFLKLY